MNASVKIDSKIIGKIKKINGGCLAPPVASENAGVNLRQSFAELHLPITRLHDAPFDNAGLNIVDVPMIFPLFHADADDPRNYNFKATDDYLANALACGTKIYYRLGVSIDHSINKYVIEPPACAEKWVDIVNHIIAHYNEGWADGFHYNIEYWEIWNEAEGISGEGLHLHTMWNAPYETYLEFYVKVAKALKKRWPALKIGGPSNCCWSNEARQFIDFVAANRAPLDFYSFHIYASSVDWLKGLFEEVRSTLDRNGFEKTEIHLTEWQYLQPDGFALMREDNGAEAYKVFKKMHGVIGASFTTTMLTTMLDCPVDMAHFYTVTANVFGLYDMLTRKPTKQYYALKAFGELVHDYPNRLNVEIKDFSGIPLPNESDNNEHAFTALGGCNDDGDTMVLVTNYRYGASVITLNFEPDRFVETELFLIDEECNFEKITPKEERPGSLIIQHDLSSSIILFKGIRNKDFPIPHPPSPIRLIDDVNNLRSFSKNEFQIKSQKRRTSIGE